MSTRARIAAAALALAMACAAPAPARAADPPQAASELSAADKSLDRARTLDAREVIERRSAAADALGHFHTSFELSPSWRAAAGASQASTLLGSSAAASAWYWLATDHADYSDAYLSWQKEASSSLFDKRAAFTVEVPEALASLRVDGVPIPAGALSRPLALDAGSHTVSGSTLSGDTFQQALEVQAAQVGGQHFLPVALKRALKAGEEDPDLPKIGPRRPEPAGMSTLQIVTVVATVALASGIAVGGGYLLFGQDNPRGLDTAEGAAIVVTELVLIGGGTAIALLAD